MHVIFFCIYICICFSFLLKINKLPTKKHTFPREILDMKKTIHCDTMREKKNAVHCVHIRYHAKHICNRKCVYIQNTDHTILICNLLS